MVILDEISGVFSMAHRFNPLLDYTIELFSRSGTIEIDCGMRCGVENDLSVKTHDHNTKSPYDILVVVQLMPVVQHPSHMS